MGADTSLIPFSAGYQYTEFIVRRYAGDRVRMSFHREEDIQAWRRGDYDRGLPVVLRLDCESGPRHAVPDGDTETDYELLKVPDYWPEEIQGCIGALVPSTGFTRRVVGSPNGR